jgi:trehalose 6-phosphate synthase/phosphatase
MAGAAKELGEALIVNPNNQLQIVWALKYALQMPEKRQLKRNLIMQKRLKNYDVKKWADDFRKTLIDVKKKQEDFSAKYFSLKKRLQIIKDYQKSKHRLFLLDYDGTLVHIAYKFQKNHPGKDVLDTIQQLIVDKKNQVVIVSGREKEILEKWFKDLDVGLIAEHGAWLRTNKGEWQTVEHLKSEWKEQLKPLLTLYVDRTPGSFMEEKEYSLVWHYIKTDPAFGRIRALELKDALLHITSNLNLEVLHGGKVIEIKPMGINKGLTAYRWISQKDWDFILAIGDDWSDEDTFAALPESAYSIKVGTSPSNSKYNINSSTEVRALLKELSRK